MATHEVCLACGGELKAGDLLYGRCQICREKNIPANPKILKAQQKRALDTERTAIFRRKSHTVGRVLRPLGLSLVGLAVLLTALISILDEKSIDSLPYLLTFVPILIVVVGGGLG